TVDGGGIRGISSLLILEHIMEKIRETRGLGHVRRPCEHFDLIGGTSTGGQVSRLSPIIAIMLGRLGMTVDECIRAYKKVAQQAFTPKRTSIFPAAPTGAFSAKALEAAIKQIVRERCVESECVSRQSQGLGTVKTDEQLTLYRAVLAITKQNLDAPPTLFTTYDSSASFHGCTIWQVARATSAATTFFKSIKVGRDEIEFVNAGFGYNNPCEVLLQEAQRQFPGRRQMRLSASDTRLSILNALKKMATSSKQDAARLDGQYGDTGQYFRFNVDQGLQDVTLSDGEEASTISAHTSNYLSANQRAIRKFIDNFVATVRAKEG
ncbi:acyl transferase/acyl hydrolase/lysophospholipase, partial [Fusarium oxysporum Fo47]|uniref:acyl transferase/acyl hydrolase/lysophospholipase n=1 Tax=Fusarium oxysporum Fo47 TaxID=660027 RepID=UPI002869C014